MSLGVLQIACHAGSVACHHWTRQLAQRDQVVFQNHTAPSTAAPSRSQMKQSMESLIHHFKLYTEGFGGLPAVSAVLTHHHPKSPCPQDCHQDCHDEAAHSQPPLSVSELSSSERLWLSYTTLCVQVGSYKPAQRAAVMAYRGAQFFGVSFMASMCGHSLTKYMVS